MERLFTEISPYFRDTNPKKWEDRELILTACDEGDFYMPLHLSYEDMENLMIFYHRADIGNIPVIQGYPLVIVGFSNGMFFDCIVAIEEHEYRNRKEESDASQRLES